MKTISRIPSAIGAAWCSMWHDDIYWPVNGAYRCRTCLRIYPVNWSNQLSAPEHRHERSVSSLVATTSGT